MRVISGKYKRLELSGFDIDGIRPTMDKVKESIFGIIQNKIKDSVCLDLFSGTGSLGIEALSNGAKYVYFVDNMNSAIEITKKNLNKIKDNNYTIVNDNYTSSLKKFSNNNTKFDIIFIDPPYKDDIAVSSVDLILSLKLLKKEGIIIIETDEKNREIENLKNLDIEVYDIRKYGRANLIFLN